MLTQETDFTAFSIATMLRPLPTCTARAKNKNKNKSKNCPCCRDYITRELFCITQEIKNPTIDTAILRSEYTGFSQLLSSQSCTLKKANTWTGVSRVDFGDPEREKGVCDIEVDTIETLACVASVSVGLGFCVRSKHFRFLAARKLGRAQKKWEKGQEKGFKKTLARISHDFEKPVRQRTSMKSGKLI